MLAPLLKTKVPVPNWKNTPLHVEVLYSNSYLSKIGISKMYLKYEK